MLKVKMDNKIIEIKNKLIPGKPLLVMGPHGTGKFERTKLAIKAANLVTYACDLSIGHNLLGFDINEWAKTLTGNGVMVFKWLTNPPPDSVHFIVNQMKNPDRIIVLTGKSCPYVVASKCANIVTISTEEHLKSSMKE